MDEMTQADRLNQHWDALLDDEQERIDPSFARTLLLLHNLDDTPGPSVEFADRLWGELSNLRPAGSDRDRWNRPLLAIAASLAVILIVTAIYSALRYGDEPSEQFSIIATEPPFVTSMPVAPATDTPGLAVVPSMPPEEPTSTPPTATATQPSATATVDPNATVPTGPNPPVQAGGGPYYETLEQMVNASDMIVVASTTDETVSVDDGLSVRAVTIERTIRGEPIERAYVIDYQELLEGERYVLFLNRVPYGPDDTFGAILGFGMLPIADGVVLAREDGFGSLVRQQYAGQSVETLAADIAAVPDIDPLVEELFERYGWTALSKQSLWPRRLPEAEAFERSRVLPFMPQSFAAVLDASKRVGLDFGSLAGQDLQLLVYLVERDLAEPRARAIWAGFLIQEQTIVGAWIVVDATERPFGLDERDAALEIPALIPTPEPTPTVAVPDGATVNPARFYRLTDTETFTFCWPYCDQEPKTIGLRDSIIAALDQELTIQPLTVQPTPTRPEGLEPSDGSFVYIVFGHLTPGWSAYAFGYDREAQLLLLPFDAGWATAPPELIEIMAEMEPPPLPTKPT